MNSLHKLLIANAVMMAGLDGRFHTGYIEPVKKDDKPNTRQELHNYMLHKDFSEKRELKEFSIQGNKVMAFSKKDAITRLKAMGKLKRKK